MGDSTMYYPKKRLIALSVVAILNSGLICAQEAHWSYGEQDKWGEIINELYSPPYPYADCGNGQKQSPVNIEPEKITAAKNFDSIEPEYGEIPLSVLNNGHTIRVNTTQGTLNIGKSVYELAQFHFHAPSEHLINGIRYPMEIHFVNGRSDGRAAVLGVFIKVGKANPVFQAILDNVPTAIGELKEASQSIRPEQLLPAHQEEFYSYAGSLTTPPCSEGVQWFVFKDAIEASDQQIKEFTDKYFRDNARSEQKLNGRKLDFMDQ